MKKIFFLFLIICSFSFAEKCIATEEKTITGFIVKNAKNEEMENDIKQMFRNMVGVELKRYKLIDFSNEVLKKYKDYKNVDFYPNIDCNRVTLDIILIEDKPGEKIPFSVYFTFFAFLIMLFFMSNG